MNDMLHYGFTLTTVWNTLCTLQYFPFTICKNNSIHAKKPLYMVIHLSDGQYHFVSPTCVLCLVSCVLCLVSGVLCLVSGALCLVSCVLCVVCCVLCVVCCVLCVVSCVLCLVSCVLSVSYWVMSDLASNVFFLRLVYIEWLQCHCHQRTGWT